MESIPDWHHRLRNVTILRRDALEIIERIEDKAGTVIYVDPPYFEKSSKYVHDFTDGQHEQLAKILQRFRNTRVIVSYYWSPRLAELYPDWQQVRIDVTKSMSSTAAKTSRETEVLLVNDRSVWLFAEDPDHA